MAENANLTHLARQDAVNNEAVEFLLSRLFEGGTISTKTSLSFHIHRWLSMVKQHDEVSSLVPECLFRVLIRFTTAKKADEIWKTHTPEALGDSEEWVDMLQTLINKNADQGLMRRLEKLTERTITCDELLTPHHESFTHLPLDSNGFEPSGDELRDIMTYGDTARMTENREVFYTTGNRAWGQ